MYKYRKIIANIDYIFKISIVSIAISQSQIQQINIGIISIAAIGYRKILLESIVIVLQDFLDNNIILHRIVTTMQYRSSSSNYLRSLDIGSKCCEKFKTIQTKFRFRFYMNFILHLIRFIVFHIIFHLKLKWHANWMQMLFQWIFILHSKSLVISI